MKASMDRIIRAMSTALDLSQMSAISNPPVIENVTNVNYTVHQFMHHSKRTAYISLEIAKCLNLCEESQKQLYVSALLHDIGATSYTVESHFSDYFIKEHCKLGSRITKSFPHFNQISDIILNHHENFDGSGAMGLKGSNIPIESQIIRISDLIEILYDENIPEFKQKYDIINWIRKKSNTIFSPVIVDTFLSCSSKDTFWFNIENIKFMDFILDNISPKINIFLDLNHFQHIAYIFANIIDSKSRFTATHSMRISELAYSVSKFIGYDEEKCIRMKIAGLLHDIGKLAIPTKILDKNGSLSNEEFAIIKSHVYYTRIILDRIGSIDDISDYASNHHEKLNGKGYPRGLKAEQLSEESRIMAVCDIYQALTEDRPYRSGLAQEKAFSIIDNMVSDGFICGTAVGYLKNSLSCNSKIR